MACAIGAPRTASIMVLKAISLVKVYMTCPFVARESLSAPLAL